MTIDAVFKLNIHPSYQVSTADVELFTSYLTELTAAVNSDTLRDKSADKQLLVNLLNLLARSAIPVDARLRALIKQFVQKLELDTVTAQFMREVLDKTSNTFIVPSASEISDSIQFFLNNPDQIFKKDSRTTAAQNPLRSLTKPLLAHFFEDNFDDLQQETRKDILRNKISISREQETATKPKKFDHSGDFQTDLARNGIDGPLFVYLSLYLNQNGLIALLNHYLVVIFGIVGKEYLPYIVLTNKQFFITKNTNGTVTVKIIFDSQDTKRLDGEIELTLTDHNKNEESDLRHVSVALTNYRLTVKDKHLSELIKHNAVQAIINAKLNNIPLTTRQEKMLEQTLLPYYQLIDGQRVLIKEKITDPDIALLVAVQQYTPKASLYDNLNSMDYESGLRLVTHFLSQGLTTLDNLGFHLPSNPQLETVITSARNNAFDIEKAEITLRLSELCNLHRFKLETAAGNNFTFRQFISFGIRATIDNYPLLFEFIDFLKKQLPNDVNTLEELSTKLALAQAAKQLAQTNNEANKKVRTKKTLEKQEEKIPSPEELEQFIKQFPYSGALKNLNEEYCERYATIGQGRASVFVFTELSAILRQIFALTLQDKHRAIFAADKNQIIIDKILFHAAKEPKMVAYCKTLLNRRHLSKLAAYDFSGDLFLELTAVKPRKKTWLDYLRNLFARPRPNLTPQQQVQVSAKNMLTLQDYLRLLTASKRKPEVQETILQDNAFILKVKKRFETAFSFSALAKIKESSATSEFDFQPLLTDILDISRALNNLGDIDTSIRAHFFKQIAPPSSVIASLDGLNEDIIFTLSIFFASAQQNNASPGEKAIEFFKTLFSDRYYADFIKRNLERLFPNPTLLVQWVKATQDSSLIPLLLNHEEIRDYFTLDNLLELKQFAVDNHAPSVGMVDDAIHLQSKHLIAYIDKASGTLTEETENLEFLSRRLNPAAKKRTQQGVDIPMDDNYQRRQYGP